MQFYDSFQLDFCFERSDFEVNKLAVMAGTVVLSTMSGMVLI